MVAQVKIRMTPEQYLAFDRDSYVKHEYIDGEIYAMAGASSTHNLIAASLIREISSQLKGKPCSTFASDQRLRTGRKYRYFYPDVTVVCGEPDIVDDNHQDTLLNPTAIFEVLSPTTEAFDRGKKFAFYEAIDTFTNYILVSQDQPRIEHFIRQEDKTWQRIVVEGLAATLPIDALDIRLALAEVYDRVKFETEE
jgi:Uma2 family endonuclease